MFSQEEMQGGQPNDVLRSAADEVLAVLKDDMIKVWTTLLALRFSVI